MPTYEYACSACGHEFEQFQSITAKPLRKCPECGRAKLERLIGVGGGIIFKGEGFYQTDYRSESYKKAAEAEKPAADQSSRKTGEAAPTAKPDASPAAASTTPAPAKPAPAPKAGKRSKPTDEAA